MTNGFKIDKKFLINRTEVYAASGSLNKTTPTVLHMIRKGYISDAVGSVTFMDNFFRILNMMEDKKFLPTKEELLASALLHTIFTYIMCYTPDRIDNLPETFSIEEIIELFYSSLNRPKKSSISSVIPEQDKNQIVKYAIRFELIEYLNDDDLLNYDDNVNDS